MVTTSPCASCKLLRRKCGKECVFAPYFPSNDPHKFALVHKVYGASNVRKMLLEVQINQRADAVSSLMFEASARIRDPVYGCLGTISYLENQVLLLQNQLANAHAEILYIHTQKGQALVSQPLQKCPKSYAFHHNHCNNVLPELFIDDFISDHSRGDHNDVGRVVQDYSLGAQRAAILDATWFLNQRKA